MVTINALTYVHASDVTAPYCFCLQSLELCSPSFALLPALLCSQLCFAPSFALLPALLSQQHDIVLLQADADIHSTA